MNEPPTSPAPVRIEDLSVPMLRRVGEIDRPPATRAGEESSRTVRMSISSETPVSRWFGDEVLSHDEGAIRMARLTNGAAFLFNHDPSRQIGVVERAWVENRRLMAEVRFSRSPEGEAMLQDVRDGIRSKVSVGYRLLRFDLLKKEGDSKTYRATSWEPHEVSLVSVPGDDSVGVGRSEPALESRAVPVFGQPVETPMSTPNPPAPAPTPTPSPAAPAPAAGPPARTAQSDASRILALGDTLGRAVEARRAVSGNQTFDEFIGSLEQRAAPLPPGVLPPGHSPAVGLTPAEIRTYSICRAIACIAAGQPLDGLEGEASSAFAKRFNLPQNERAFYIPHEVQRSYGMRADLAAGTGNLGGVTVQTDVRGSDLIELLRARLISSRLGVVSMFGLQGNVSIPAVASGATGAWLSEGSPIVPGNPTFGQVPLSPKRYGAATAYSRQLVVQSSLDVESFVRTDLAATVARAFDLAVIDGTGAAGQPTGIMRTSGVGTLTFGGAANWAKVVEFETTLGNANADFGSIAYLSTPSTRGKWKQTPKVAADSGGGFLWQDAGYVPVMPAVGSAATPIAAPEGIVNGYRAVASTIVPTNRVVFGNFADAILAAWIPLEVIVDPYSLALNHQVRVVVNALGDVGVRHAASFVVSTDTGAA